MTVDQATMGQQGPREECAGLIDLEVVLRWAATAARRRMHERHKALASRSRATLIEVNNAAVIAGGPPAERFPALEAWIRCALSGLRLPVAEREALALPPKHLEPLLHVSPRWFHKNGRHNHGGTSHRAVGEVVVPRPQARAARCIGE